MIKQSVSSTSHDRETKNKANTSKVSSRYQIPPPQLSKHTLSPMYKTVKNKEKESRETDNLPWKMKNEKGGMPQLTYSKRKEEGQSCKRK